MTRLIEVLISLAIVAALFLVIGLVLPSSRHLSEQVETNRKMTIVYDTLDSLRRFKDWNPLVLHDPQMQIKLSGPESGVGAQLDYVSKVPIVGSGNVEDHRQTIRARASLRDHRSRSAAQNKRSDVHPQVRPATTAATSRSRRNTTWIMAWTCSAATPACTSAATSATTSSWASSACTNMLASVPNVDYRMQGASSADLRDGRRCRRKTCWS